MNFEMKKKWMWKKREIKYFVNNNIVGRILMRLYFKLEELIWLGIGVGILVVVVKLLIF